MITSCDYAIQSDYYFFRVYPIIKIKSAFLKDKILLFQGVSGENGSLCAGFSCSRLNILRFPLNGNYDHPHNESWPYCQH
jgi:hypothetical protein